ncbi:MAG: hypothetical protein EBS19_00685 [Spirochaetia bacterium]|nr:hypothetical protein [Spirochaetia bacterium]
MDFSKVLFNKLLFWVLIISGFLSLIAFLFVVFEFIDKNIFLGIVFAQWFQNLILLSKTYFMRGSWMVTAKPQLIITGLSLIVNIIILFYFSFFRENLLFILGFFIANYFSMKIFVTTAYILQKYETKNE